MTGITCTVDVRGRLVRVAVSVTVMVTRRGTACGSRSALAYSREPSACRYALGAASPLSLSVWWSPSSGVTVMVSLMPAGKVVQERLSLPPSCGFSSTTSADSMAKSPSVKRLAWSRCSSGVASPFSTKVTAVPESVPAAPVSRSRMGALWVVSVMFARALTSSKSYTAKSSVRSTGVGSSFALL